MLSDVDDARKASHGTRIKDAHARRVHVPEGRARPIAVGLVGVFAVSRAAVVVRVVTLKRIATCCCENVAAVAQAVDGGDGHAVHENVVLNVGPIGAVEPETE